MIHSLLSKSQNTISLFISKDEKYRQLENHVCIIQLDIILSSSGVERSAVNRFVVGSNPTWGEIRKLDWAKIFRR